MILLTGVKHTWFIGHIKASFFMDSVFRPMTTLRRVTLVSILVCVTFVHGVQISSGQDPESSFVVRFQLAESFLRSAQFQRAITILEDLYQSSPETHLFYDRLRTSYENLKRYDDAIALVEERIARERIPTGFLTEKARLLYLKGDEEAALRTWQEAIATNPTSPGVFVLVYHSLMKVRLFEFAIQILEQGRSELENTRLFQNDLAYLYSITSQHAKALQEYVDLLQVNENQLEYIRLRLDDFMQDEGALESSIAVAEAAVAQNPLSRPVRELLAYLYIEADRFRSALQVYQAVDLLEEERGGVLFSFAQTAADASAFDVASETFSDILERYPEAPSAADALRGLGIMLERWAHSLDERVFDESGERLTATRYHEALSAYASFLEMHPTHVYYPDVLRRMGHLHQDVFFDLPSAEIILTEVITSYPQTTAADEAMFDLGRLMIQQNHLINAQVLFSRLVTRHRTGDQADRARYELSLLHFYRGEFDSALSLVSALQENTSADVANDAIELRLLLMDNRGPDSLDTVLTGYARAMLFQVQREYASAYSQLQDLADQYMSHPLTDEIMFAQAGILQQQGRLEEAIQGYIQLSRIHSSSFLADRSLFRAATIYANELEDSEAAIDLFSRLLHDHPKSLLIPEARHHIRRLRGDEV